jgi:hypothetical protein
MALALATVVPLAPLHAEPAEDVCRGPKDETELAALTVRVVAAKRERFISDVRTFAAGLSLGVGSATDGKGWIVLMLETRPYGVIIEIEATDANNFHAVVTTCNATQDWRPLWASFKSFIDANRAQWNNERGTP